MSSHQSHRLKNRCRSENYYQNPAKKITLFTVLLLFVTAFSLPSGIFAACDYLSSGDFGAGSGWTANQDTALWTIKNGMLDVTDNNSGLVSYAWHEFTPPGFFSLDTDISIINAVEDTDRVGIRVFTTGDQTFVVTGDAGQYTTKGINCYYYPVARLLKFKIYDIAGKKWVLLHGSRTVTGAVNSIGLSMSNNEVIFRINRQDTDYKFSGNFSSAPGSIDNIKLQAAGNNLHARFDNICAASYEITNLPPADSMSLPSGQEVITTSPAISPLVSINPAQANPFGFGAVANGGSVFSLDVGLSALAGPVDLYIGIGIGSEIYLFGEDNRLHSAGDGLRRWRSNTTGGINTRILPEIDLSPYPGTYTFYFLMTPAGRSDVFRQWTTPLVIVDNSPVTDPVITDKAMELEIKQYINLIFGATSGFSGGMDEFTAIFSDKNVVTTTPAELSLATLFSGAPITITVNFGAGYTMESGSVMRGSAQILISNIKFSSTGLGADFSGAFNNVTKDGAPFVNGQISGNLQMTGRADENYDLSGQIIFTNLTFNGQQLYGTIQLSGIIELLDLDALTESLGTVRLTFTNFIAGADTINSGYVEIVMAENANITILSNLQTSKGAVNLNLTSRNSVFNTTSPGIAGPYTVVVNGVTLNKNICANFPAAGTISFTKQEGLTGVVTFTGACDGTYHYEER